jgi:hypothetical protein
LASLCPHWHGSIGPQQTPQTPHLRRTLHKSICPEHVHRTLSMLEVLDPHNTRHAHLRAAFFKHKYLTNPLVTLEDQVIVAAARLTDTLQGIKSPQLHTSTLQALGDLRDVFYEAANATNAPLFAADTSQTQVAPLPPHDSPPVLKARNCILSPLQSPRTPPRVQPNLAPDLATILIGQEAPLIPSDVPPQQIAPPTPTPISPTKPLYRSQ